MSPERPRRYRVTVEEVGGDGAIKERIAGTCSAYVVAICADVNGELRVLTDHDGPTSQRRKAIRSLTEHVSITVEFG